jgi:hypothetical protein
MADSNLDMLRQITAAFRQAMAAEDVTGNTADRIMNRVLYGDPGGPGAIYELREDGRKAVHMGPMPVRPGMATASGLEVLRAPAQPQQDNGPPPDDLYLIES